MLPFIANHAKMTPARARSRGSCVGARSHSCCPPAPAGVSSACRPPRTSSRERAAQTVRLASAKRQIGVSVRAIASSKPSDPRQILDWQILAKRCGLDGRTLLPCADQTRIKFISGRRAYQYWRITAPHQSDTRRADAIDEFTLFGFP